jgi:hypothetical protein
VIRKRLEIVLAQVGDNDDIAKYQRYQLESGASVSYSASRLGNFLMSIYLSLFERRDSYTRNALEALVARNVRRALGIVTVLNAPARRSSRRIWCRKRSDAPSSRSMGQIRAFQSGL